MGKSAKKPVRPFQYFLTDKGEFVIKNYNFSTKLPSFLPGVAGKLGIPMWVFYVNRAQGVVSFGVDGKDSAFVEFFSANRSFQLAPLTGFRTFYRMDGKTFSEPFQRHIGFDEKKISQKMIITSYDLTIEEINHIVGLETRVNYFTVPNEPVGALSRHLTVKNLNKKPVHLEILDGLPQVVSAGLIHFLLKDLTNLTEAWVQVENVKERNPFYKVKVAVSDKPQVEVIKQGNFYFSRQLSKKGDFFPVIIDPRIIFDEIESFTYPHKFLSESKFEVPQFQRNRNLFPCGFSFNTITLKPGEEAGFITMAGNARTYALMTEFKNKCENPDYVMKKKEENHSIIRSIQDKIMTVSSDEKFDAHCRQCFLDNVLRGGYPYTIRTDKKPVIFHIFSRRHGDLERDYNRFKLLPTYYSQGNGNYRDVNQNRRNDIFFNPETNESTIRTFMNLIQLDGYNPLIIKGSHFWIDSEEDANELAKKYSHDETGKLKDFLIRGFTPGDLIIFIEEAGIELKTDREAFLSKILSVAKRMEDAEHGEGFWSDHWSYNTDLIESYLSVYPERARALFFEEKDFRFFENSARVMPRQKKCFLTKDGVRQFHSVFRDEEKERRLLTRTVNPFAVRSDYGKGPVYSTTLFVKFVTIAVNKAATLDPYGMGIELEADKPNWYDALNGLPGLFGSSISETYELKRMILMLKNVIEEENVSLDKLIVLPEEVAGFLSKISHLLKEDHNDFDYWDRSHTAKEEFREKIVDGISGIEADVELCVIMEFFNALLVKLEKAIEKSIDKDFKIPLTYFSYEVTDYEKIEVESNSGEILVWPKKFRQKALPLFLEGPVHAMRCETDPKKVLSIHKAVTGSPIFDRKLKMYKVNASLEDETYEIGRTKIFPAGWLENESVWVHMEYKYLLEILKKGLYEEFYKVAENVLIPYLDSSTYGRSILENSSFIVSSAYYDRDMHGRGFVARLSGSTAEFIHIWLAMTIGQNPFSLNAKKELCLKLKPALPGRFFTVEKKQVVTCDRDGKEYILTVPRNAFAFKFLGVITVVYKNPKRLDTWQPDVVIKNISVETKPGAWTTIDGDTIRGQLCHDIRDRKVLSIEAEIGEK
ncbi:MAG: hypothetical protein JW928_04410 [Candidatus Aureabacteria bacterium]|nr:hypothetical protein [Candidatus Auribacterota bacterium]